MKKIKIAITGGIGSGKSLVSDYLEKKGFPVLRADLIAKELMAHDPEVKGFLITEFGPESFLDDKLNTKFLAEKVFSNEEDVLKINAIVHLPTMEKIDLLANDLFKSHNVV
ncbi:MAG: dephospho-CoA kinase, partial [Melioribacteraceae bacterium]